MRCCPPTRHCPCAAAIDTLAAQYRQDNPQLTVAQSRADALVDLVLSDVQVTTTATLIIPTTDAPTPDPADHPGTPTQPMRPWRRLPASPGPSLNPVPNRRAEPPPAPTPSEPDRRAGGHRSGRPPGRAPGAG